MCHLILISAEIAHGLWHFHRAGVLVSMYMYFIR
jgi:hypothetical protein